MHLSPMHVLVVALVILVLFGRGKVSALMGEFGKGITAFKKGVKDGSDEIERDTTAAKDVTPVAEPEKKDQV